MFKSPVIKVEELLLNDEQISMENEKGNIFQINLIDSAKKSLKLSKFTSGSLVGSVYFPLDQIRKPLMDSNQLEFNVKGPVHFKALDLNKNLKSFNVRIKFNSEDNMDMKAFSSLFDYWILGKLNEQIIDSSVNTLMTEDFIKRLPKANKKSPFVKIFSNKWSKNEEEDNKVGENFDSMPKKIQRNNFISKKLTEDQETCLLNSSEILYGME